MAKNKKPGNRYHPSAEKRATNKVIPEARRQPKGEPRPGELSSEFLWSFHLFEPCTEWNDDANEDRAFHDIGCSLRDLQLADWPGLLRDSRRCHDIAMVHMIPEAQKRLVDRKLDVYEKLMRLRCTGANRIYGIRTGHVFSIIWWDPDHRVCPSDKD